MATESSRLTNDDVFEILSNARRRRVIFLLHTAREPMELGELAEQIATAELGEPPDQDQYKRLYISLYQTHLPKLEEHGVVEYDTESKLVTLTERVQPLIDVFRVDEDEPSWWKYYALLAIVSAVVVIGYWVVYSMNHPAGMVVAVFPVIALIVLVVYHYHQSARSRAVQLERMIGE